MKCDGGWTTGQMDRLPDGQTEQKQYVSPKLVGDIIMGQDKHDAPGMDILHGALISKNKQIINKTNNSAKNNQI